MDCKYELIDIMDRCIEEVKKDETTLHYDYLIGLIEMKILVMNYIKDKNITAN